MSKFNDAVEKNSKLILDAHDYVWRNPETGYREKKTSRFMEEQFEALGYNLVKAENIPGFYTVIDTGRPGPEVLVMAELDSLICHEHPESDPETGAVHCCGHSAQCAALLGVAAALKEPQILDGWSGRIRLCAVPAEELIEIEYRTELKNKGIIKYFGGKTEFLSRGYFDGVDLAFMVHTTQSDKFILDRGMIGTVLKKIIYKGVSSHAGGAPWDGCNALYAATQGLSATNAIRERFKEDDMIRVHPIITKGGGVVNAIPDEVIIESQVRGKSFEAIKSENKKINLALCGGALSLGANVEIIDIPGYAPFYNDTNMIDIACEGVCCVPNVEIYRGEYISSGCSDIGDLGCLMPVVHPYVPGATGTSHGNDYRIIKPELACVGSAKIQINMLNILLKDGAARALKVVNDYKPMFESKEQYFEYVESFKSNGDRIKYKGDVAEIKL